MKHHTDWDPTVFSAGSTVEEFIEHCESPCGQQVCVYEQKCSHSCPCWHFLAPHRFAVCLSETLELAATLLTLGAYSSDVEEVLSGLLTHVWQEHTPADSTSLDEIRRCETAEDLAENLLPVDAQRLVAGFTEERIAEACDWDTEEEERLGHLPCGADVDDDSVHHWRTAEMTTRSAWEQIHRLNTDVVTPLCEGCDAVAEKEIAFADS